MSIKHALLGLLAEEAMHGYRLKEVFDERVSALWGLTTAQIYQTLGGLERCGLLQSRGERVGNRPERRIYAPTVAGRHELARWLDADPCGWIRPYRAEELLRLLFVRAADVPKVAAALDRAEEELVDLQRRASRGPRSSRPDGARIDVASLFRDGLASQLDADLTTMRRCREELAKWEAAPRPAARGDVEPSRSRPRRVVAR